MTSAKNLKVENNMDDVKEMFTNLSLNELIILSSEVKKIFEEKGLSHMLVNSSGDNKGPDATVEKAEKAMIRLKKVPFVMKDKIALIKLLSEKMSWPLNQAKGSIEVLPLILKEGIDVSEANRLKEELCTIPEVEIEVEVL